MYEKFSRSDWFRHDRFGMFIHWGLYAIPARYAWMRNMERVTVEGYQPYFETFNPIDYDPKAWARAASDAGMKYAVMTAKHHDGFCLFDSALTNYKATNTPAGRDLIRPYLEAFRAEGLKVGLYYSLLDWHHPDYPHFGDRCHPMRENKAFEGADHHFERYIEYMHGQVKELVTNYGKLDIMWFDFSYDDMTGEKWQAARLVEMIRAHQPDVLIDNRLEVHSEDYGSIADDIPSPWSGDFASPEQVIPMKGLTNKQGEPIPWEACITMNNNWGYFAGDKFFKPAPVIIRKLVECVSKGGNMLLNVGPDARGNIPAESLRILSDVGLWMKLNGGSIYGCGRAEMEKPEWGRYTARGNKVYAHVYELPIGPLYLPGIERCRVKAMRLLSDGSEIRFSTDWMPRAYKGLTLVELNPLTHSCALPDDRDTVFEIEVE